MLPKCILILVFCVIYMNLANSHTPFPFNDLEVITKFSSEVNQAIGQAIELREITNDFLKSSVKESNEDVVSQLDNLMIDVEQKLSQFNKQFEESSNPKLDLWLAIILQKIVSIKAQYENIMKYAAGIYDYVKSENFGSSPTELEEDDTWTAIQSLFHEFDPLRPQKHLFLHFYEEYVKTQRRSGEFCGDQSSPVFYLYNLYTLIVSAEIMGLSAIDLKYGILHKVLNRDFNEILSKAQETAEKRLGSYSRTFREAMNRTSWNVRACDPPKNIRHETFYELEGLYQDIFIDEYGHNSEDSCKGDCKTIHLRNYQECSRVFNCSRLREPTYCETKLAKNRYSWVTSFTKIKSEIKQIQYGTKNECHGETVSFEESRYWTWLCEKCVCICEGSSLKMMKEKPNATHVFSLLSSESDIQNNMVVIGVRFIVENAIVHIKVKEGRLGKEGLIEKASESWNNNPDMRSDVIKDREGLDSDYHNGEHFIVSGENMRAINLDDVIVPEGHVVTGIKFGLAPKKKASSPSHLKIQVQYTPFDWASGQLDTSSEPQWISSTVRHGKRLNTRRYVSSEYSTAKNIPSKSLNSYIEFSPSNLQDDVGQTTIPFLDGVPVETKSGPLSGIGIFHKGTPEHGGFLSFQLHLMNIAKFMV